MGPVEKNICCSVLLRLPPQPSEVQDSHHPGPAAAQITKEKQAFQRVVVSREEALSMFQENKFKVEIISGLPADATISLYRCGPMVRASCSGSHRRLRSSFPALLSCWSSREGAPMHAAMHACSCARWWWWYSGFRVYG